MKVAVMAALLFFDFSPAIAKDPVDATPAIIQELSAAVPENAAKRDLSTTDLEKRKRRGGGSSDKVDFNIEDDKENHEEDNVEGDAEADEDLASGLAISYMALAGAIGATLIAS